MHEITLKAVINILNPSRRSIRINTIIPMTQKVISDIALNNLHIISFPDLDPNNFIFNSFIGGDVILGENNGVENCILIANGQFIKFGKYNSLQNLEAHGSDIREVGVEWGNGNFIAHRAIFHGCKGGDNNYLGVGTIIGDLSNAGSSNYFFHGTTIGFSVDLKNKSAYKGSYIDSEEKGNKGMSESAIEFENQRTGNKIPLGKLFHDGQYNFMKNTIVPRTHYLLSHLSLVYGGYIKDKVAKQPAHGVLINHVLATGEFFVGLACKIVELLDKRLSKKLTKLQQIYTYFLNGTLLNDSQIKKMDYIWDKRENLLMETTKILDKLILIIENNPEEYSYLLHHIEAHPEKRFTQYKMPQKVLLIKYEPYSIPLIIQTKEDLLHCKTKLTETCHYLEKFFSNFKI